MAAKQANRRSTRFRSWHPAVSPRCFPARWSRLRETWRRFPTPNGRRSPKVSLTSCRPAYGSSRRRRAMEAVQLPRRRSFTVFAKPSSASSVIRISRRPGWRRPREYPSAICKSCLKAREAALRIICANGACSGHRQNCLARRRRIIRFRKSRSATASTIPRISAGRSATASGFRRANFVIRNSSAPRYARPRPVSAAGRSKRSRSCAVLRHWPTLEKLWRRRPRIKLRLAPKANTVTIIFRWKPRVCIGGISAGRCSRRPRSIRAIRLRSRP